MTAGRRRRRLILKGCLAGIPAGFLVLGILAAVEWRRLPDIDSLVRSAPSSTVLLDRRGDPIRFRLTADERLVIRVPLERISPHLVQATIAAEDARFRSHFGVDPAAVLRAAWVNLTRGRITSGASTITMQVARLLRPLPRGYYNKFREAILAVRLESALDKDRILELYLNLSPYGGNACGVEAGSLRYFGRPAGDLSLSEAALLAGLPQSPGRLRPDRHPDRARARRDWILERMAALGMVDAAAGESARAAGIHVVSRPLPLAAPHFTEWALRRCAPGERVRTTLDPAIQAAAEEVLRARLEGLRASGVRNGAVVVAETESGRIRALVGSQDFFDAGDGQVNGADAQRSPGSLLKPFIYGLAFERGIAGPETILQDAPRSFRDGYEPLNFSGGFLGPVTAREALVRSLNVPAVDLLSRVGPGNAVARMRSFGLRGVHRSAGHYGLSLGLGGVEVTLLELVEAYAALGRLGLHRPLSFREDESFAPLCRVLDRRAARRIAEILEEAGWPAEDLDPILELPRLALKTGTSFGFRDAWAIGYSPVWTIGVWIGNFDGEPSRALVGREAAVPAALGLARRLHGAGEEVWYEPVAGTPGEPAGSDPPRVLDPPPGPGGEVRWILPADGSTIIRHDRAGGDRLQLRAESSSALTFSWFIDGSYAGRSAPGAVLERPFRTGLHRITLVASNGHAETRTVKLED